MVVWSVPKGDMVAVAPAAPRSALVYLHTVFVSQKARPPILQSGDPPPPADEVHVSKPRNKEDSCGPGDLVAL